MAQLLDGKAAAKAVRLALKKQIKQLLAEGRPPPGARFVQVGGNPASTTYVNQKQKMALRVGFDSKIERYPDTISQAGLLSQLDAFNNDPAVHAILVQLPLPKQISEAAIVHAINPAKDVDCFHPENVGRLAIGLDGPKPATPQGVMLLLDHYGIELQGKRVTVLGRSNLVGKPMGLLLLARHATVTYCHSRTADLAADCSRADVLIAAAGRAGIITAKHVKSGAIVVDVGTNFIPAVDETGQPIVDEAGQQKHKLVGDVDFDAVEPIASYISPVPGGVGPMTIASVLANTLTLYKLIEGQAGTTCQTRLV